MRTGLTGKTSDIKDLLKGLTRQEQVDVFKAYARSKAIGLEMLREIQIKHRTEEKFRTLQF